MKKKFRPVVFLIVLSLLFLARTVTASSFTASPKIQNRSLNLQKGMASDQIRFLKDFFRAKGEANVSWGYVLDESTIELLKKYQADKGLTINGRLDKPTIDRINQEIREENMLVGLIVPSTNVKGDMLIVNKSSNTLYFLKNGSLYKSYPIATGKDYSRTPDGKHKIVTKLVNPSYGSIPGGVKNNPLGPRWMGIDYAGGWIYGIHGNSDSTSIGKYISLGCIRMFNEEVEKLYPEIKMNTPVWIGSEDILKSYGVNFKYDYGSNTGVPPLKTKLIFRGKELKLSGKIINKNDRTFYPLREVLELAGAKVDWNSEAKLVSVFLNNNRIDYILGSSIAYKNGDRIIIDDINQPFIENDRTYIGIRNAFESLGFNVSWEDSTKSIYIN